MIALKQLHNKMVSGFITTDENNNYCVKIQKLVNVIVNSKRVLNRFLLIQLSLFKVGNNNNNKKKAIRIQK